MRRVSPQEQKEERRAKAIKPKARRPSEKARAAAKESFERRYLYLSCGHLGAREDTERMRYFRPGKQFWYCDVEGIWSESIPRKSRTEYPEKVPFL